jgi:hypothetical protein
MSLRCLLLLTLTSASADDGLRRGLSFHADFDQGYAAALSADAPACLVRAGKNLVPAADGPDVSRIADGRFGSALRFHRKGSVRPEFAAARSLAYSTLDWSATVSVWLRTDPDRDLAPGYCDPVQVVGDDTKKGFIFLEWSKDHQPRHFRFAVRPLYHLWNPDAVGWEEIPDARRPMVRMERAPFGRSRWTHVVFTLERLNAHDAPPKAHLYVDGRPVGSILGHDLTFGWDPSSPKLVLGAAYVGDLDDVAAWNRVLAPAEVAALHALPKGASSLRP